MTSGPLDHPRPRLTLVPPLSAAPAPVTRAQVPLSTGVSRAELAAVVLLSLAGALTDRAARMRRLAMGVAGRMPWAGARAGPGSRPEGRVRGTDADPRSVCLLGGPFPLVGSPNSIRAGSRS